MRPVILSDSQLATIALVRQQSRDLIQVEMLKVIDHLFECAGMRCPPAPAGALEPVTVLPPRGPGAA